MDVMQRLARYAAVSTELAHCDDDALRSLLKERDPSGWSTVQTIEIAGQKVLLKAVPLTEREHALGFATGNLYELPTFYQYGVGSAGFGAWRELVASLTASNWVVEGVVSEFALLYHWRVIERPQAPSPGPSSALDEYVRNWNSSIAVRRYAEDRLAATHVALLFLEWFPLSLWDHLANRPDDIAPMVEQICRTVAFLHRHDVFHFDTHFGNVVTDGKRPYLVDFGLAMDGRFDLSAAERAFMQRHCHYDYGEAVRSIRSLLDLWYEGLPEQERQLVHARIGTSDGAINISQELVAKVESLGGMVHPALQEAIIRHRPVIGYMDRFFREQRCNERKDTPFDDELLHQLLVESGVIS